MQNVDYVLIVGLGGGVSHYMDQAKNVKLGDVVLSANTKNSHSNTTRRVRQGGEVAFETKSWNPKENTLQLIWEQLTGQVSLAD